MNKNLSALILIILSAGIYFTVTQQIFAGAQAVKTVNDQYSSALSNASALISTRDEVLKEYNAVSDADRARLDKMIPSSVDNIRLIIDLNSLALRHGFSLAGVKAAAADDTTGSPNTSLTTADGSPLSSISTPTLDTVSVSFSATAGYDQFISFLQDIESDLRVMDLVDLSISSATNGNFTYQVKFQTYWLRQ